MGGPITVEEFLLEMFKTRSGTNIEISERGSWTNIS